MAKSFTPLAAAFPLAAALVIGAATPLVAQQPVTLVRLTHDAKPGEHPIEPTLQLARKALKRLDEVSDYSCNLIRRERIAGKLTDYQYQHLKVRHRPFSVYLYYQAPKRGSEVIYVEGRNDGQLWAHEVGAGAELVGTVSLAPDGARARKESRHPVTKAGLSNLLQRVISTAENDRLYGECEVKVFPDAKVNGRSSLAVEIRHPTQRREFRFPLSRVYFDYETGLLSRYEAYDWPTRAGAEPPLLEEYTFTDLKFDNGFTDRDFDIGNAAYNFPRER